MQAGSVHITNAERHDACHQRPGSQPPATASTLAGVVGRSLQKLGFDKDAVTPLIADAVKDTMQKESASAGSASAAATAAAALPDAGESINAANTPGPGKKGKRGVRSKSGRQAGSTSIAGSAGVAHPVHAIDGTAGMQAAVSQSPGMTASPPLEHGGTAASIATPTAPQCGSAETAKQTTLEIAPVKSEPAETTPHAADGHRSRAIDTAAVAQGVLDALIQQTAGNGVKSTGYTDEMEVATGHMRCAVLDNDTAEAVAARLVAFAINNVLVAHGEQLPQAAMSVVSISDDSDATAEADAGARFFSNSVPNSITILESEPNAGLVASFSVMVSNA